MVLCRYCHGIVSFVIVTCLVLSFFTFYRCTFIVYKILRLKIFWMISFVLQPF